MDDFTIARALHVLAVVAWIGGVAFVTTVLMPSMDPARDFARMEWGHRVLLVASLVTVFGAVAGSHGWFF